MANTARRGATAPRRATAPQNASRWTPWRVATALGTAGPLLFLGIATVTGLTQPGYDPRTQPLSEIALGSHGWIMTANFFFFGLVIVAFAVAFFRGLARPSSAATAFIGLAGLGIIASGLFPTDPQGGPETPTGTLHNTLFLVLFLALVIGQGCAAFALRREPGWRGLARYTALTPLASFALLVAFIGFGSDLGDPLFAIGGLLQRLMIAVAFGWMTVIGRRLLAR